MSWGGQLLVEEVGIKKREREWKWKEEIGNGRGQ